MTNKKFNWEQKQRCLDVVDQLTQSGLSTQDFSQIQGMSYRQLRAWKSHALRWRAQLANATPRYPCTTQIRQSNSICLSQGGRQTPTSAP